MTRLLLIRPQIPIKEEARNLARLRSHIRDLQEIYKTQSIAFARRVLNRADLAESIDVVGLEDLGEDVIVQFRIRPGEE